MKHFYSLLCVFLFIGTFLFGQDMQEPEQRGESMAHVIMQRLSKGALYISKGVVYIGSYGTLYVFKAGYRLIFITFKAGRAIVYSVCIHVPRLVIKYTFLFSGGYFVLKLLDIGNGIARLMGLRSIEKLKP